MISVVRIPEIILLLQVTRLSNDKLRCEVGSRNMHEMLGSVSKEVVNFHTSQNQPYSIIVVKLKDLD